MKIKFILSALEEAKGPYWRPQLATLASLCSDADELEVVDEHVENIDLEDKPDLVVIQSYVTNANRAYTIAETYPNYSLS